MGKEENTTPETLSTSPAPADMIIETFAQKNSPNQKNGNDSSENE